MIGAGRLALAAALVASIAAPAAAEPGEQDPYSRDGFYVSLGGYYQKENYADTCDEIVDDVCVAGFRPDSSGGAGTHAGYRFHRYAAAEIQFEWVKDALEDQFNESAYVVTANIKPFLPFGRFQPFALVGFGYMRAPVPVGDERDFSIENGITFRFGGGIDLYATEHWALVAETSYVQPLPVNQLDKVPFLSVGGAFQYRF